MADIPIIAIAGPTAAGKSALSLALWDELERGVGGFRGAEIVSVDSAQIYRGMDIGSAKPDAATRARVPHHLLDILDPAESYSAARFAVDAATLIEAIRGRGRVPLLVGGTFLYFRALLEGLSELPAADPAIRADLEAERLRLGAEGQHAELARLDPATAARLHVNDAQRVLRALEIHRVSGIAPSAHYAAARADRGIPGPVHRVALIPRDTMSLDRAIAARLEAMFAAGFVDEVAGLRARGDLHLGLPSMRAVGYRQIWRHLDGEYGLAEARSLAMIATRQYAKRQRTWLRGDARWQDAIVTEPISLARVLNHSERMPQ